MKYFFPLICDLPGQKQEWHPLQRASRKAFVVLVNWWFRFVVRSLSFLNLIFLCAVCLWCVDCHTHRISALIRRLKETQAHLWLLVGTFSSLSPCLHWWWISYLSICTSISNGITSCFFLVYVKFIWRLIKMYRIILSWPNKSVRLEERRL